MYSLTNAGLELLSSSDWVIFMMVTEPSATAHASKASAEGIMVNPMHRRGEQGTNLALVYHFSRQTRIGE